MGEHGWARDKRWEQCHIRIGTATLPPSVAWELPHRQAVALASNSHGLSLYIYIYIYTTYLYIINITLFIYFIFFLLSV